MKELGEKLIDVHSQHQNQEAEKSHINVSKVLQEALMAKLGVSR